MSRSLRLDHGTAWAAELAGVAVFVLAALTAVRWTMDPGIHVQHWPLHVRLLVIGTTVGATIALIAVSPLGRRSGAHLNPAVSLFMTLRGVLGLRDLVGYVAAQLIGSVAGVLLARLLWRSAMDPVADGVIQPAAGVGARATAVIEAAASLVLLLSIAWLTARPRPVTAAVGIGIVTAGLITLTGSSSGGSIDPARNFGPQVLSGVTGSWAIYLVAPLAAAPIAVLVLRASGARRAWTHAVCGDRETLDRQYLAHQHVGGAA